MSNAISVKAALAQGRKIGINTLLTKYVQEGEFADKLTRGRACLLSYPGKSDFVLVHMLDVSIANTNCTMAIVLPVENRDDISEKELSNVLGDLGGVFVES